MRNMEHTWRSARGLGLIAALAGALAMPAMAQTRSPEIVAKERRDPASGEVIILNSSKTKKSAPDPYAPIKLKPLQQDRAKAGIAAAKPADTAVPKGSAASAETPPLPGVNKAGSETARLRQFPQAPLAERAEEPDNAVPKPRRARRTAPQRETRRLARRDDGYDDERRYRRREPQTYARELRRERGFERPWGQCRQLAWRCQDGFPGACQGWRRNCS